jgi:hypothetical protein
LCSETRPNAKPETVIANFKMRLFDKIFGRQKFDLEIIVPTTIEIVHMDDKVRFRGTKEHISKFRKSFIDLKDSMTDNFANWTNTRLKFLTT